MAQGLRFGIAVLALLILNSMLNGDNFVHMPPALLPAGIAVELVVLLGALALVARRGLVSNGLLWAVALLLLGLWTMRLIDFGIPIWFSRRFNLATDIRFVPFIAGLARSSLSTGMIAAVAIGGLAMIVLGAALIRFLLGRALRPIVAGDWRPAALAAGIATIGWFIVPAALGATSPWPLLGTWTAEMVTRQTELVFSTERLRREMTARIAAAETARSAARDLSALGRRNVVLVFVESYGNVTFTEPRFARHFDAVRADMARRLAAGGVHVATARAVSPITGGGSWFAHTTMLTGMRLADQGEFEALMTTNFTSIAHDFTRAGYRSLALMPKIEMPWPEGARFGFERIVLGNDMPYRGPRYVWDSIPDQFTLEWLARDLRASRDPLFAQVVLVSSHSPFDFVPPLVDDWRALGDGEALARLPRRELPPTGFLFENEPGYFATIEYSLEAVARFVADRLDDETLVIALGDHQPPLAATRGSRDLTVPVHVMSRSRALIDAFIAGGFAAGMNPGTTTFDMAEFRERFVRQFSRP